MDTLTETTNGCNRRGNGVVFNGKFCVELPQLKGLQHGGQQRGSLRRREWWIGCVCLDELAQPIQARTAIQFLPRLLEVGGRLGGKQGIQAVLCCLGDRVALEGSGNIGGRCGCDAAAHCLISLLHP